MFHSKTNLSKTNNSQKPMGRAEYINKFEESHNLANEEWNLSENNKNGKIHPHLWLSTSKKMRDYFDDEYGNTIELNEPCSVLDIDDWVDINKHIEVWSVRVDIWRERFNEMQRRKN